MFKLIPDDTKFDFVGQIGKFGAVSLVLVLASYVTLAVRGLNYGIDFAGGYEIQARFPENVDETAIRGALEPLGMGDVRVQRFGAASDHEYLILVREHGMVAAGARDVLKREFETLAGGPDQLVNWSLAESGESMVLGFTRPTPESSVREVLGRHNLEVKAITRGEREDQPEYTVALVSLADIISRELASKLELGDPSSVVSRVEFVGPQVGAQLRNQGFMAVLYSLLFILLYIAFRFDFAFSPGAILSLVHDTSIVLGVFSLFQIEFNLPVVAAILALIGFSLNDTIVVYDRIREDALRFRGRDPRQLVNEAINQTLSRTILTSGITAVVVAGFLFLGGGVIRDFAIAFSVGIVVGTYSSIFVAAPIYILLRERRERKAPVGAVQAA